MNATGPELSSSPTQSSTTSSSLNPVIDVTDHHHNNYNNNGISLPINTSEIVGDIEMIKSNLPIRIENNKNNNKIIISANKNINNSIAVEGITSMNTIATTTDDNNCNNDNGDNNNQQHQKKKISWVKFDDDGDDKNNGNIPTLPIDTTTIVVNSNNSNNNNNITSSLMNKITTNTTIATNIPNNNGSSSSSSSIAIATPQLLQTTPTKLVANTQPKQQQQQSSITMTTKSIGIPTIPGPPVLQNNNITSPKPTSDITKSTAPAVLSHINLNSVTTSSQSTSTTSPLSIRNNNDTVPKKNTVPTTIGTTTTTTATQATTTTIPQLSSSSSGGAPMRTIELSTGRIREGFANGDIIVTLLPTNTRWPWITPAIFRPELVPEELMAQGLTLTVEEYVNAMETLVNDYRFTIYNICYKRVLVCWILFAFCVLLTLLFSGLKGIALFSLGVGWLFLNAAAIFFCMWIKLRLSRGLEKCLARVNKQLIRHKIILILDDRGRISCHKVNLCFLYFDPAQCISYLNEFIERCEQNGTNIQTGWETKLDVDCNDIVIQGNNPVRLSRKQERGLLLYLRYGSRWGNEVIRGLGDISITEPARHCSQFICPCQYIERHLSCKPRGKSKFLNIIYWVLASERYEN